MVGLCNYVFNFVDMHVNLTILDDIVLVLSMFLA